MFVQEKRSRKCRKCSCSSHIWGYFRLEVWKLRDVQGGTIACVWIWESVVWYSVAGCSNSHKDGVTSFKFPTDQRLRRQWTRQIERTRAKWSGRSERSCVCGSHTIVRTAYKRCRAYRKTLEWRWSKFWSQKLYLQYFLRPYQIVHLLQRREDTLHSRRVNVLVWATLVIIALLIK